ncbi:Uncharacterised protein [Bordetella pertussis]|nr:Uncharacterised protein [Bordetella pertussis]CFW44886.1 Uncharacterised protein [Bordetella pertussis]
MLVRRRRLAGTSASSPSWRLASSSASSLACR